MLVGCIDSEGSVFEGSVIEGSVVEGSVIEGSVIGSGALYVLSHLIREKYI